MRRALWLLAGSGVALGLAVAACILTNEDIELPGLLVGVYLLIGWSFIGVGLFAWARRPDNRVGMLMAATGFSFLVAGLGGSDIPLIWTFGQVFSAVYFIVAIHLLLAFPDGRLQSRGERVVIGIGYFLTTVGNLPAWFFLDPREDFDCADCPENVLLVERSETTVQIMSGFLNVVGVVLAGFVLVVLVRRWRRATAPERRVLAYVWAAGVALMLALAVTVALQVGGGGSAAKVTYLAALVPFALVPWLFLFTLLRTRMIQGGALGRLMARLSEAPRRGELRDALADALGDPSLELVFWLPEREHYVDAAGRPFDMPDGDSGRAVAMVERDGNCVGAIIYDASMREADEHVRSVGVAALLALENEGLEAELRAKVAELRESRERMLSIGLEERRRLERDLHDGAQQRLVSMALNMRLARSKLRADPDGADQVLAAAGEELDAALAELRELARGIHPAILSDRGLSTALETLASRAPLPVELGELPRERLPEAVELAAYFVVSESLTNVAKYADASRARVSVERENGRVLVSVADDGVGGADPEAGSGLRGLADRIAILEGRLDVDSPPGAGTTVTARIPLR